MERRRRVSTGRGKAGRGLSVCGPRLAAPCCSFARSPHRHLAGMEAMNQIIALASPGFAINGQPAAPHWQVIADGLKAAEPYLRRVMMIRQLFGDPPYTFAPSFLWAGRQAGTKCRLPLTPRSSLCEQRLSSTPLGAPRAAWKHQLGVGPFRSAPQGP